MIIVLFMWGLWVVGFCFMLIFFVFLVGLLMFVGGRSGFFFFLGQEEVLWDCYGNLFYDVIFLVFCDIYLYLWNQFVGLFLEIMQEVGEMVFVFSGWYYQVYNLDDIIFINYNWVNGFNLVNMWCFLQQELCVVQEEVSEWRDFMFDWYYYCQVIMRFCLGINFEEFYYFFKVIVEKRFLVLREVVVEDGVGLGFEQVVFDVGCIIEVLVFLVVYFDFQRVDISVFLLQFKELLQQLREVVDVVVVLQYLL